MKYLIVSITVLIFLWIIGIILYLSMPPSYDHYMEDFKMDVLNEENFREISFSFFSRRLTCNIYIFGINDHEYKELREYTDSNGWSGWASPEGDAIIRSYYGSIKGEVVYSYKRKDDAVLYLYYYSSENLLFCVIYYS